MTSWIPERLHDLIYRMDTQYTYKGKPKLKDYIYMWLDNGKIAGCILPDGDAIYVSIRNVYENLYKTIIEYAKNNCRSLFNFDESGNIDFLVIANNSLKYREDVLKQMKHEKQVEEDYDNYVYSQSLTLKINIPEGFQLVYGDEYSNEVNKWSSCNLGFHTELENPNYKNDMVHTILENYLPYIKIVLSV